VKSFPSVPSVPIGQADLLHQMNRPLGIFRVQSEFKGIRKESTQAF